MKIMYPDYNNCIVNVSNSILKHYGVPYCHNTLSILDEELANNYKNVVLIVFDGLGSNLLNNHLSQETFLKKHKVTDITSVFPATTTAATTALITGLTPSEHCWLAWDVFIASLDKTVTLYLNVEKGHEEQIADYSIAKKEFPYTSIFEKINLAGTARAYCVSPFEGYLYDIEKPHQMYEKVIELCKTKERNFIYAYCNEPDQSMHYLGTQNEKVLYILESINRKVEDLCSQLNDTLIIITADHGHMTVGDYIILDDFPIIQNMLIRETSIEARATNFFVKEHMIEHFKKEFNKLFGQHFILLSKKEIVDRKLFGSGSVHEKFESCLGDFIALAISNKAIIDKAKKIPLKGLHAGITEDEIKIPLILIKK